MWTKPIKLALPELAADHPLAPEGVELYRWVFPPWRSVDVHVHTRVPVSAAVWREMEAEGIADMVGGTITLHRQHHERHGGLRIWFAWNEDERVAAAWVEP